ncbi:MAG: SDR family NAD(P)-dependent oxidoreductase [Flavobacteriaceae bacterium]
MDRIVIITGVSRESGLGFETARQMKDLGYKVIITARDLGKVSELAEKIGVSSRQLDITNDQSINGLVKDLDKEFGKIDVLINNAGSFFDQGGEPLSADIGFIKEALDTNLLGAWRMIKAFYNLIEKSGQPRIVNVSSGAGSFNDSIFGLAYHFSKVPVYGITKLALNGLTVKFATQFKDSKIKINSVDPGFTATYPGTEDWGGRPVNEGAKGIVWAATLPNDGPSGGFFKDGEPINW